MSAAHAQKVAVTEADPNVAEQDTLNLDVKIKGRGFGTGAVVTFWISGSTTNNGGVTVNSAVVHDSKNLTANINVPIGAAISDYDIEVAVSSSRRGRGTTLFSVKLKGGGNDTTPPAPIDDFRIEENKIFSTSAILKWTAPGDDGDSGSIDHYVLQRAPQVDPAACDGPGPYDLGFAEDLPPPEPSPAGWLYTVPVEGLVPETCYVFTIQPFDEVGNTPGPFFTAGVTTEVPSAGAWQQEVLPTYAYRNILAFDPNNLMQPVVFANDKDAFYFVRSPNNTWTTQTVRKNANGGISFGYNLGGQTFGGVLQNTKNIPSYAELQPDGSWDITQITRDRARQGHSVAFDAGGGAIVAYRTIPERVLHLARYNGSSFDIETPQIPGGLGQGWGADLKIDPLTGQPTIVYLSEDKQEIRVATGDGNFWSVESIHLGLDFGSDIGIQDFEYDSNNQPVILFRQALHEQYAYFLRLIRKDSSGNWGPESSIPGVPDGMTIFPNGLTNQNGSFAIADDGTIYLLKTNTGGQVSVGRFCEKGRTPALPCETSAPTQDAGGANIWYWEIVHESAGASLSIAIDDNGRTISIITGGYYACDPLISVICGNQ
jgi:hypothetical protein